MVLVIVTTSFCTFCKNSAWSILLAYLHDKNTISISFFVTSQSVHILQRKSTKVFGFFQKKIFKNLKIQKKFCKKKLHFASLEDVGKSDFKIFQLPLHAHFFTHFFCPKIGLLLTQKEKSSRDWSVTKKSCNENAQTNQRR